MFLNSRPGLHVSHESNLCYVVHSCIQCRHPLELGGIHFFVNALRNIASWFVVAALYLLYYPAGAAEPAHGVNASTLAFMVNFSAKVTGTNSTGAPSAFPCNRIDTFT